MVLDPEAAAYGIFQIAFASMDTRLSRALVTLCRCESTQLTFSILSKLPFGGRLAKLRKAIKDVDLPINPDIQELKTACDLAENVQKWRNSRIHAEVRFSENRPVLVDREGEPLQIDREECERKIRDAIRAGIAIEVNVSHLVAILKDLETLAESSEADI